MLIAPCFPQAHAFLGFGEKSQEETYADDTRGVIVQMRVRALSALFGACGLGA